MKSQNFWPWFPNCAVTGFTCFNLCGHNLHPEVKGSKYFDRVPDEVYVLPFIA
jgi:hypothetical protein